MEPCTVCGFDPCVCYSFEVYDIASRFPEPAVVTETPEEQVLPIFCVEKTKKGAPCKNKPKEGFTRCGPHQDKWEAAQAQAELPIINEEDEYDLPDPADSDNKVSVAPPVVDPGLFIVAGTGSRSVQVASAEGKAQLMNWLRDRLTRAKDKYGDSLVIMSGMAEGFDKALAVVALQLDIKLWCVVPSEGYGEYYWGRTSVTGRNMLAQFNDIISKAWRVTYVMPDPRGSEKYGKKFGSANFDRNDFMVRQGNAFLVYDPSSRGTEHCFAGIKASGKPFELVPVIQ